jgi:hypothetical protein
MHRRETSGSSSLKEMRGVYSMLVEPAVNTFAHVKPGDTPW